MSKVTFKKLNPEKFAEFIFDMKECLPRDASINRGSSYFSFNIPEELVKEIISSECMNDKLKEKITSIVKDFKQIDASVIKRLQDFWSKKVNNIFFQEMEKFMPKCSEENYDCYVTDKMVGSYFEENNEVSINTTNNKCEADLSSIVAEEILHLIYWKFWKKLFNKDSSLDERFDIGNDKINGWSISEVIPDYLLIENKSFKELGWSKIDRSKGYPWITRLRKELNPLWGEKIDFSDFILNAHALCGFKKVI